MMYQFKKIFLKITDLVCLSKQCIKRATVLITCAGISFIGCKADCCINNNASVIQSVPNFSWIDPKLSETLSYPICIQGKFYNEHEDGRISSWEPFNNIIESVCIGCASKFKDVGNAFQKLLQRRHNVEDNHESWRVKPVIEARISSQEPVITWLGHSTFLIQINGIAILTDPVFEAFFGCRRRVAPVVLPENLPHIDIVLLSHNHRDHMDEASLLALKQHQPVVLVPTNNGSWFCQNGFEHVIEKSWWEQEQICKVACSELSSQLLADITCVPAKHWSTRYIVIGTNSALCSGWYIRSQGHSIYFVGDTGYKKDFFEQIRSVFGRPELMLMPVGPNEPRRFMDESHMSTEQALEACKDVSPQFCIPMHWGTFALGTDSFDGPIEKLRSLVPTGCLGETVIEIDPKFGKQWYLKAAVS